MTPEEKQLLLKDLCARLPYRVMIKDTYSGHYGRLVGIGNTFAYFISELNSNTLDVQLYYTKPYLRPMSSMTEGEKDELYTAMDWYGEIDETGNVYTKGQEKVYRETFYEYTDWLNAHHFDHRGLIPMGLALEAPEGMYKTE